MSPLSYTYKTRIFVKMYEKNKQFIVHTYIKFFLIYQYWPNFLISPMYNINIKSYLLEKNKSKICQTSDLSNDVFFSFIFVFSTLSIIASLKYDLELSWIYNCITTISYCFVEVAYNLPFSFYVGLISRYRSEFPTTLESRYFLSCVCLSYIMLRGDIYKFIVFFCILIDFNKTFFVTITWLCSK